MCFELNLRGFRLIKLSSPYPNLIFQATMQVNQATLSASADICVASPMFDSSCYNLDVK